MFESLICNWCCNKVGPEAVLYVARMYPRLRKRFITDNQTLMIEQSESRFAVQQILVAEQRYAGVIDVGSYAIHYGRLSTSC